MLGTFGDDPAVIAAARARVDDALSGGQALDPEMATTLVQVAARHGDAALFDALVAAAEKAATPEQLYGYLGALAFFEDPALTDRGLGRLLTGELRNQDAAWYLRRFLANPNAGVNRRAWTFLKTHWTELQSKIFVTFADASMMAALSSFCDAGSRDDIMAFFAAKPRPTAARALQQSLERITNCIALREQQAPALAEWVAESGSRRGRTP
jgi:aminopeptidase N